MSELTHEELTRLLDYDPETGVFRWKVDRRGGRGIKAGDIAGGKGIKGNQISINGKLYFSRRVAWLFVNGCWPERNLFIKNKDRYDDSIKNIGILPQKPKELTQDYLKECIYYNPEEGELKWKITQGSNVYGEDAFCILNNINNYARLKTVILGRPYSTFRLIVLLMTGYMPSENKVVMPIDNNLLNLKWSNIKIGDWSDAIVKSRVYGNSSMKGVYFKKDRKKYRAQIRINGKQKHLGDFPTEAEAHAAYMKAARKHYGELANDGYQHAMYEMEYEEVERPVEPNLDEDIQVAAQEVAAILDGKIEPVVHHADDF